MIQAGRLGHVVLKVRDAARSRDFYVSTLGLKVAHEDLERGTVFLSFGREHHDLALFQLATGEPPAPAQPGLHHVAWRLASFEELRAAYRELKDMGVPVSTTAHNVTSSIYFTDPDGNGVELYCDMVENGFEAMRALGPTRAPLDLESDAPVGCADAPVGRADAPVATTR
jgi:catechol 2,3-dioxygenase